MKLLLLAAVALAALPACTTDSRGRQQIDTDALLRVAELTNGLLTSREPERFRATRPPQLAPAPVDPAALTLYHQGQTIEPEHAAEPTVFLNGNPLTVAR